METIPNCTNLHAKKERKNLQNLLQDRFFCDILEQNGRKMRLHLHIPTVDCPLHKLAETMNIYQEETTMSQIVIPEKDPILAEVLAAYDFPATLLGAVRYGQGHINDTFCVICQPQEGDAVRYILQGLSLAAFPRQDELMENFIGITSYLREKIIAAGGDPLRETLSLVKTRDGKDYYTDGSGKVWRLTPFIENTDCFQSATPELF